MRDLFNTAKKAQPGDNFIDEVDAIGRQRAMLMADTTKESRL